MIESTVVPRWLSGIALGLLALGATGAGPDEAKLRQPSALAFSADGSRLFAANRRSGTLSEIDPSGARLVAESPIGRGLADVVTLPDGRHLLAVDQAGDALILIDLSGESPRVAGREAAAADPVRVVVASDGLRCVVGSLRSRKLTFFDLAHGLSRLGTLDLPFSPRAMVLAPGGEKLIVADAYGGGIAVVDVKARAVLSTRTLPAHNIGGLAVSPEGRRLMVTHQRLNRQSRSGFQEVLWGQLLGNHLRVLLLDSVLDPSGDDDALLKGGQLIDLGFQGDAAGDPTAVGFGGDGGLVIALTGVDALGLIPKTSWNLRRVPVGRAPKAMAISPDGTTAYLAESLDDRIAAVDLASGEVRASISLGSQPDLASADRGERLFSDARLSLDGWMSCQSCHTDGHTNGLFADTLGDGTFGAAKRVPTLLGVGHTAPWAWNGEVGRLEDQVRKSISTTMRGRVPTDAQVADLVAYLHTLEPPRPVSNDTAEVARGRAAFEARSCTTCHTPGTYTSSGRYDVGLEDELGRRKFNPPSLIGVGDRPALLHDGRAGSIDEVLGRFGHPDGDASTPAELADLIAFLKTL